MYRKESDKQKERIQNLIKNGADSHDIAKQVEFYTDVNLTDSTYLLNIE
jgi:hypothetical protein